MLDVITTHWKKDLTFESDNPSGKSVVMDTAMAGEKQRNGLSPKAMMLSSLVGCSALDVISILKKMKALPQDFKIKVSGELTDEHPKHYNTVVVDYHFYGSHLDQDKCARAVQLSVDKYCGVMEMFRKFAKVTTRNYFHAM